MQYYAVETLYVQAASRLLTVIETKALIAPTYTTKRGCLIAMIAAMMKVSSPSSVTRICNQSIKLKDSHFISIDENVAWIRHATRTMSKLLTKACNRSMLRSTVLPRVSLLCTCKPTGHRVDTGTPKQQACLKSQERSCNEQARMSPLLLIQQVHRHRLAERHARNKDPTIEGQCRPSQIAGPSCR